MMFIIKPAPQLPPELPLLANIATAERFHFVNRLMTEFELGNNRFDRPGEALFAAWAEETLIGVGGLNIDPYFPNERYGRVRHLYVRPEWRQQKVGTALMVAIEGKAAVSFARIQLFTPNAAASRFYEALGYTAVAHLDRVSHFKWLTQITDENPLQFPPNP